MASQTFREWMDDLISTEAADLPHRPRGAMNIIVYDDTNTPPPGDHSVGDRVKFALNPGTSLTFWWKAGGFLDKVRQFTDTVIPASTWDETFDGILAAVDGQTTKQGNPATIASLQFWGHGSAGASHMGKSPSLTTRTLGEGGVYAAKVAAVARKMHPSEGSVWFRQCNCFMGQSGQDFAVASSRAFDATTVGHTFIIHAWQSGTRTLRPRQTPDWDLDEGKKKRGREKGKLLLSAPMRRRTVNMFRLYPPLDNGEIILPNTILGPMRRGLTGLLSGDD
jgi:hypothetical protein